MKKFMLPLSAGLLIMAGQALATDIIPANSAAYYPLSGGSDISMPPVSDNADIDIGGDVHSNLGYTCTGFNPSISISNSINDIQDSIEGLGQDVIASATSAVGSLPMYLLSKSNKDLYNLIQNTMTGAGGQFHLSMKSCQDSLNDIHNGKSPYQDWFGVSDSQGWLKRAHMAAQGQKVDINDTTQQMTKKPNETGIPWVHEKTSGNSGGTGTGQAPIKVIYDVVVAGYNVTVDPKSPLDAKTTKAKPNTALARYFPVAGNAGDWGKLVLGDITISAKAEKTGDDKTAHGTGLMTIITACPNPDAGQKTLTCAATIAENLQHIVASSSTPTGKELSSVSSGGMMATPQLITAIRAKTPSEQALSISKWSQDVAIQNVVDKANTLRTLLVAGAHTKAVHNLQPAQNAVKQALLQLNDEIQALMQNYQIRKALTTHTAETIMASQTGVNEKAMLHNRPTQAPHNTSGVGYKPSNQE